MPPPLPPPPRKREAPPPPPPAPEAGGAPAPAPARKVWARARAGVRFLSLLLLGCLAAVLAAVVLERRTHRGADALWTVVRAHGSAADHAALGVWTLYVPLIRAVCAVEDAVLGPLLPEVVHPVFVLGHPRSGTTQIFRTLARAQPDAASLTIIDAIVPSTAAQAVLYPVARFLMKIYTQQCSKEINADLPEEDDFLFGHSYKHFFPIAVLSDLVKVALWENYQPWTTFDADDVASLRRVMRRKMWFAGKTRWMGKPITTSASLDSLLAVFPDARLVLCVRNPSDAIFSYLRLSQELEVLPAGSPTHVINGFSAKLYTAVAALVTDAPRLADLHVVRFEEYIRDERKMLGALLADLGLEASRPMQLFENDRHTNDPKFRPIVDGELRNSTVWHGIFARLGYDPPSV